MKRVVSSHFLIVVQKRFIIAKTYPRRYFLNWRKPCFVQNTFSNCWPLAFGRLWSNIPIQGLIFFHHWFWVIFCMWTKTVVWNLSLLFHRIHSSCPKELMCQNLSWFSLTIWTNHPVYTIYWYLNKFYKLPDTLDRLWYGRFGFDLRRLQKVILFPISRDFSLLLHLLCL